MVLWLRPYVFGYFLICNFFLADTASIHTHLVNPVYECRFSVFGVPHSDYFD